MQTEKYSSVDQYIKTFPDEIQVVLEKMRKAIKEAAPKAEELISYNMPAYKLNGILVYFAANKKHIGFYPAGKQINQDFKKELENYKTSPGTIQFPYETGIPVTLVKKIVKVRIAENLLKAEAKKL